MPLIYTYNSIISCPVISCPVSDGRQWINHNYIPNVEKYIIDFVNNKNDLNDNISI